MSKLSIILQVCNDNLVYQCTFGLYRDIPLMKVSVRRDSENSLKIVIVPLKSGLLETMTCTCNRLYIRYLSSVRSYYHFLGNLLFLLLHELRDYIIVYVLL